MINPDPLKQINFVLLLAMLLGTAGCSAAFRPQTLIVGSGSAIAATSNDSDAGFIAFKNGMYAFVNTQGCVECHASIVHPSFAAADVNQAYANAKGNQIGSTAPLIDFNNPTQSIFITYAGNSHCGAAPCSDPSVRAEVQSLLVAWANAELAGGTVSPVVSVPPPTYLTQTIAMPTSIASITQKVPTVIRFSLAQMAPRNASFLGAILEIEVQMINSTEYRFNNPKIVGGTAAVAVDGLHVFIRPNTILSGIGTEDLSQGSQWDSLVATAAIAALPAALPVGPMTATPLTQTPIEAEMQSSADMITIGFDQLK